ncbi:hepatitis A virus cellular receptor 1 isoform X2 [Dasypus novemcinctus]|uniref:hepatitis A virus cellular receptor 1 isoform X2 n=1 Tax=Dasypus novemcinctus TaxID=9361 RepID=UPI000328B27D|nr:hepatitis A virus cellular receptor 1 isoform X2 [Dasypus novemcinctus]
MQIQAILSSLLVLLTGAVVSYQQVSGVVGQSVLLPCTYSVAGGEVTTMCWGQGQCPTNKCSNELIWTDGSRVTFQKHKRYKLKGNLLEGNVSLTIENAAKADSGLYCCRVELRGWFNDKKITLSLEIKPARDTSVPTSSRVSTSAPPVPAPTKNHKPAPSPFPTQSAITQFKTLQDTRMQLTSSPCHCGPTDGNGTVTQSSDGLWHSNQTGVSVAQEPQPVLAKGIYVSIGILVAVLLSLLVVVIIKRHLYLRSKLQKLSMVSLNGPQIGALQSAAEERVQAEDNIYTIEENFYVME